MFKPWKQRPPEEAYLFNPAFLGSLIFEFVKEYSKQKSEAAPLEYIPIFLAIVLHKSTKQRLPHSTVTSLYDWLQENEDSKIDIDKRIIGLMPYIKESLRFSISRDTLKLGKGHGVVLGEVKAHFTANFLRETTTETKEIIDRSKFVARWFAKSGSEISIMGAWGIKL